LKFTDIRLESEAATASDSIAARVAELGLRLPAAPSPAANYVPFVVTGNLVYVSGQLPIVDGTVQHLGRAGEGAAIEDGYAAARLCALNVVAQVASAIGDRLSRVKRCVNVTVFVNAIPEFTEHPRIANGASDLLVEIFGDAGRHSRAAVGVGSLPRGALTEVQAVFEIDPGAGTRFP
jgi:enamine deaminase RidA (YjgF/YER057c/UK114 family)